MNKKFLVLITILCFGALAFNTYTKKENLIKSGENKKAVIEKITTNKYDNDLSPTVENIHIKYSYTIGLKKYAKTQEISRHEHDLYFSKTGKIGDSIDITYDINNPANSMITKIIQTPD
ncbi:hypothetical protein [Aquimarina pacifica]|uniref:hypothetical protein n=1 Tax=Aquimarina pacifica TaxID=1296415 RepID=UPI000470E8F0|nr:hypothetical protein [Aquimarina pacifica]